MIPLCTTANRPLLLVWGWAGVFEEMEKEGVPAQATDALRGTADCSLNFFGHTVDKWVMYLVLVGAVVLMIAAFVLIVTLAERKNRK